MSDLLENYDDEICPECGKGFEAKSITQKYCSLSCGEKYRRAFNLKCLREETKLRKKDLTCQHCGSVFDGQRASQKYCSKRCREAANYQKRRFKKEKQEYTKFCPTCLDVFQTKTINKKYCSQSCQVRSRRKPRSRVNCPSCGSLFIATGSDHMFCSNKCWQRQRYACTKAKENQARRKRLTCIDCGSPIEGAKCTNAKRCFVCGPIAEKKRKKIWMQNKRAKEKANNAKY